MSILLTLIILFAFGVVFQPALEEEVGAKAQTASQQSATSPQPDPVLRRINEIRKELMESCGDDTACLDNVRVAGTYLFKSRCEKQDAPPVDRERACQMTVLSKVEETRMMEPK